jgi:hypothetical protein
MILSTTCEGEDMVAAARPPPRGVRSDAVDHLQLSAVVVVALLPAEGALGAPPELHILVFILFKRISVLVPSTTNHSGVLL